MYRDVYVTKLAGILVIDSKKALDIVSQGGDTKSLKNAIKNIYINLN